ncbi:dTMP kinase [Rhodococcus aerolatus]
MGYLVAVEGLDGAGKATLTAALTAAARERGATVAGLAFPRYGASVEADLVAEALRGEHGDLAGSVRAMAVLFALDRAGAAEELRGLREAHDLVLLDRYAASNAAFGAARRHEGADGPFAEWVLQLELGRLGLPVPDLHVLLRVDPGVAGGRARQRADADPGRDRDAYERDDGLQQRTAAVYDGLAARSWSGPWLVADGAGTPGAAAAAVLDRLGALPGPAGHRGGTMQG